MAHQHCQHIKEYNIAINCYNIQNYHENVGSGISWNLSFYRNRAYVENFNRFERY